MNVEAMSRPSRSDDSLALHDLQQLEDVGFMTCMTLVLLGNYAQTGHFGGPLAYTPFNVVTHLAGRERGQHAFQVRLDSPGVVHVPGEYCDPQRSFFVNVNWMNV